VRLSPMSARRETLNEQKMARNGPDHRLAAAGKRLNPLADHVGAALVDAIAGPAGHITPQTAG
jgi:hypothetical protein